MGMYIPPHERGSKDVTESAHERTLRTYGIKGPSSLNLIETDVIGPAIALRGLAIGSFKLLNGVGYY